MTNLKGYSLNSVNNAADWATYHRIRRDVLFAGRGRRDAYDENHPDERKKGNLALLIVFDGKPVGTLRLDLAGETGTIRLMAVEAGEQRRGHGSAAITLVKQMAGPIGLTALEVNPDPAAAGFYQRLGFRLVDPDVAWPRLRFAVEKRAK